MNNQRLKLISLVGTRPQIIKAAAISRAAKGGYCNEVDEIVIHTGQHYDKNMSQVFFDEMNIPQPKYNLGIGLLSQTQQTAAIMVKLEEVLLNEKPDVILVYGDTNSTLAGALTACKMNIPVVHIEAGLRSFNKTMPEEVNRICTDHVSTLLFAPTQTAIKNLKSEGFNTKSKQPYHLDNPAVFYCGDIMLDNSIYFRQKAESTSSILKSLNIKKNDFVLATLHRPSNTDDIENLYQIFKAIFELSEEKQTTFVIPLHPRTRKMMNELLPSKFRKAIQENQYLKIIEPVSFFDMITLEANSKMIITDSGGVQKESYFFNKPCIILREETEWIEIVKQGTAKICGSSKTKIKNAFNYFTSNVKLEFPDMFGDGHASEFIIKEIINHIGRKS